MFNILMLFAIAVIGTATNLNLAYAMANNKPASLWKLTQHSNRFYINRRTRFGRWHYAIAIAAYLAATIYCGFKIETIDFAVMVSAMLDVYAFSSLVLWFFLEAKFKADLRTESVNAGIQAPIDPLQQK